MIIQCGQLKLESLLNYSVHQDSRLRDTMIQ